MTRDYEGANNCIYVHYFCTGTVIAFEILIVLVNKISHVGPAIVYYYCVIVMLLLAPANVDFILSATLTHLCLLEFTYELV